MKKKKLFKISLNALEQSFHPLNEEYISKCIGGGLVSTIDTAGGTIANWTMNGEKWAIFHSPDGSQFVLEGVHVGNNTLLGQQSNTACYAWGEIRIGNAWTNFSFNNLIHEYGHYLQEQLHGSLYYYGHVAPASVVSVLSDPYNHSSNPVEKEATDLGNAYFLATGYGSGSGGGGGW